MTDRHDLATAIDRCVDDLLAGRATVEECLARYPQHRAELELVLGAATSMRAIPRRAEQAPSRIRRATLMEQIRQTPQERRHRWWPRGLGVPLLPRLAAVAAPIAAVLVIGVALLAGQPATPAVASTLTVFSGAAEEQVQGAWRPLADGSRVPAGARLRTSDDGHALLTFPDGSTAALAPATEVAIERLVAATPRAVQLRQFSGRLWNDVVSDTRPGAVYEVVTPDGQVQVHGTVFETVVEQGRGSVATSEGQVDVVVGNDRVRVPAGEIVRTRDRRVEERAALAAAGSLTVDAPFAAALLSERGEATGARTDGAIFRQIRGVTTSDPGAGPQRFDFHRMEPGTYTLMLQRFEPGDGDIVVDLGGAERRIPIDAATGAAQVRLRVDSRDGRPQVTLSEDRPQPVPPPPAERPAVRIIETERTKQATAIAAQRAAAPRPPRPRPDATGTGTARPAPEGAGPAGTTPVPDPAIARLREAIGRNDAAAVLSALREIAATTDEATALRQLRAIAALVGNPEAATRVGAALQGDAPLRTRLLDRASRLPDEERDRLRRALSGEGRPERAPSVTASPVRTPTPGAPGGAGTPRAGSDDRRDPSRMPALLEDLGERLRRAFGGAPGRPPEPAR